MMDPFVFGARRSIAVRNAGLGVCVSKETNSYSNSSGTLWFPLRLYGRFLCFEQVRINNCKARRGGTLIVRNSRIVNIERHSHYL